jgi:hypothetical protein
VALRPWVFPGVPLSWQEAVYAYQWPPSRSSRTCSGRGGCGVGVLLPLAAGVLVWGRTAMRPWSRLESEDRVMIHLCRPDVFV